MARKHHLKGSPLATCALALLAATSGSAQEQPEAAGRRFVDEIRVTAVEVPVQVLRDGRPVRGLTRENFELVVDGKPRELTGFEIVDLGAPGAGPHAPAALAPPGARRNLLFLFDFLYSDQGSLRRAIADTRVLVASRLGPNDRAAIGVYGGRGSARLLVPFTADRERLVAGLDLLRALQSRKRTEIDRAKRALAAHLPGAAVRGDLVTAADELGPAAALVSSATTAYLSASELAAGATADEGRFADPPPRDPVIAGVAHSDPAELAADLADSAAAATADAQLQGIAELVTLLRDLPGQKHLVLFSRGLDPNLLTRRDSLERAGLLNAMQRLYVACRAAGWAVQPIDLAGVPASDQPGFAAESLFAIAAGTGGRLYENYNEFDEATERLLLATSVTYVLVFQREDGPADGHFHRIDVKLRGAAPGAVVVHRPGYDAPQPAKKRSALERRLDRAAAVLGDAEVFDLQATARALAWRTGERGWRVVTFVDVASTALDLDTTGRRALALEVGTYALDADRRVPAYSSRLVRLDLDKVGLALRGRGLRIAAELELPPGEYRLRLLVHDVASGHTTLFNQPLALGAEALWPPLVAGETGWLTVRSTGTPARGASFDALRLDGRALAPLSDAALDPNRSAELVFVATGFGSGDVRLAARVVDLAGREIGTAPLGPPRNLEALAGFSRFVATLRVAELLPGEYRIEVVAEDPATGTRLERADLFVVR